MNLDGNEYRRGKDGRWRIVTYSGDWEITSEMSAALDKIERLTAIVDRLPTDHAGNPIVPCDTLWEIHDGEVKQGTLRRVPGERERLVGLWLHEADSRAAAEKASGTK